MPCGPFYASAVHDRTSYMIAEIPQTPTGASTNGGNDNMPSTETSTEPASDTLVAEKPAKVMTVRVRVGGELVSSKTKCIDNAVKNFESAMQQVRKAQVMFISKSCSLLC